MNDRLRVLVIDDDPGIREYLETLVSRQGYRVLTVADGEEAIETLTRFQPDLVTLDLVLPGMDGLETLRHLKKRLPDVPVVMVSGHGQAKTIVEAMPGRTIFRSLPGQDRHTPSITVHALSGVVTDYLPNAWARGFKSQR